MTWAEEAIARGALVVLDLDETTGTVAHDSTPNLRNGTYNGGFTLGAAPIGAGLGPSVDLTPTAYVEIPNAAWMNVGQTWSAEVWFRLDALPGTGGARGTLVSARSNSDTSGSLQLQVFNNKLDAFYGTGGNFREAVGATTLATGVDYQLIVATGTTTMRIYLNKVSDGSIGVGGSALGAVTRPIRIGNDERTDRNGIDGQFSSFALYDYELTADDVAALHTAGTTAPGSPAIPVVATSHGTLTATASIASTPRTDRAPGNGRRRGGHGVATWEPPIVHAPITASPLHAVVATHAYTGHTMHGTRPQMVDHTIAERTRHLDRVLVGGRDITWWRGVRTPLPTYGLVEPLLYGSGSLDLPQIAVPYETPGRGALGWLRPFAPVHVQRVNPSTMQVVATDFRGFLLDLDLSGKTARFGLGGDATGRANLQDKQPPIFRRRNDLGWWWWDALRRIRRPFEPAGGPNTSIGFYDFGGMKLGAYMQQLAARGVNLAGTQWTCMPDPGGVYRVRRKDRETIDGTVYLDDSTYAVAQLRRDPAEEPNRIYGTGITPEGMRAKFGVYPVLADTKPIPFPNEDDRPIQQGHTNADSDTGGGVTALLARLSVTGYLTVAERSNYTMRPYDAAVASAVRDVQEDADLPTTGKVDPATWAALFDIGVTGYSTAGSRIEPIFQKPKVRPVRRSPSGNVLGPNPKYDPHTPPVDLTLDFGTDITIDQMRDWARDEAAPEGTGNWVGTIRFPSGALIRGEHTPGDPIPGGDVMHARALRPGMNLWLPLFDGGTLVHVSGVRVDTTGLVTAIVDTRARDTMKVYEVIKRNQDNARDPARAWIRDHRSSSFIKDNITEFDEVCGKIVDTALERGWNVVPVLAANQGTIARLELLTQQPAEYVVAVFGKQIGRRRLHDLVGNPLRRKGAKRWVDQAVRVQLDENVMLYVVGDREQPCGYSPARKEIKTEIVESPNPDYDPEEPISTDNDPLIETEVSAGVRHPLTGKWEERSSFGYRTFNGSHTLWLAIYSDRDTTLQGGRVMWPQLEAGS